MIRLSDAYYEGEPLHIGRTLHLFADDTMVEDRFGLCRRVEQPRRYSGNPLVRPDKPWENNLVYSPTVLFDPETNLWRMWYHTWNRAGYFGQTSRLGMTRGYCLCYAESRDGFDWYKPELDLFALPDGRKTNLISIDGWLVPGSVFFDPNERDHSRRYKIFYIHYGVCVAYSPDGIHFTPDPNNPLLKTHSDTSNQMHFDPVRGKWIAIMRPIVYASGRQESSAENPVRHQRRRIAVAQSDDGVHFGKPRTVLYPDEVSLPDYDAMSVFNYEDSKYIGLLSVFDGDKAEFGQRSHIELAFSDDLLSWERLPDRPVFFDKGRPGAFDDCAVAMGPPKFNVDNNMTFYYSGSSWEGDNNLSASWAIGAAMMTPDRFVGQYGGSGGGYLITREFVLDGSGIEINARSKLGLRSFIRAEICEYPGKAIEGFSFDHFKTLAIDHDRIPLRWEGADVSSLRGRAVFLRFELCDSYLYGFRVTD